MFEFEMKNGKFTVLNISDMQPSECDWDNTNPNSKDVVAAMDHTIRTLIERVKPDLITVTGDISMATEQPNAYPAFADYMEQFGIPWCAVWGNHEQQDVTLKVEFVNTEYVLPYYRTKKHFFHEDGPKELGNGNYLIEIKHEGKPVHTLFMMDSHNCVFLPEDDGQLHFYYDKLNEQQLVWYKEQAEMLKAKGCYHSSVLMHIPCHAYDDAWKAAFKADIDPRSIDIMDSYGEDCWNEGYKDSFGMNYEDSACYPHEDGVLDALKAGGIADNVLVGHCHANNSVIRYEGIRFAYTLKTGKVRPFYYPLNGGTVITVNADGSSDIRHEYVDIDVYLTDDDKIYH